MTRVSLVKLEGKEKRYLLAPSNEVEIYACIGYHRHSKTVQIPKVTDQVDDCYPAYLLLDRL